MMDAFTWATSDDGMEPPPEVYGATRDVAVGRLSTFSAVMESQGMVPNTAFLMHTGDARLAFQSPTTTTQIPGTAETMSVVVPDTYAALTIPKTGRTAIAP